MKQYKILENRQERSFNWGKMSIIAVGERGRGRYEDIIPCADNITENDFVQLVETKSGKKKIVKGSDIKNWLAYLSGAGIYTRNTYGTCKTTNPERVEVICKGNGAFGIAGRIGDYYEFIAIVQENTWIFVKPAGGESKIECYWLYFGQHEVFKVAKSEIEMFCDAKGLDVPDIEKLFDLA